MFLKLILCLRLTRMVGREYEAVNVLGVAGAEVPQSEGLVPGAGQGEVARENAEISTNF